MVDNRVPDNVNFIPRLYDSLGIIDIVIINKQILHRKPYRFHKAPRQQEPHKCEFFGPCRRRHAGVQIFLFILLIWDSQTNGAGPPGAPGLKLNQFFQSVRLRKGVVIHAPDEIGVRLKKFFERKVKTSRAAHIAAGVTIYDILIGLCKVSDKIKRAVRARVIYNADLIRLSRLSQQFFKADAQLLFAVKRNDRRENFSLIHFFCLQFYNRERNFLPKAKSCRRIP